MPDSPSELLILTFLDMDVLVDRLFQFNKVWPRTRLVHFIFTLPTNPRLQDSPESTLSSTLISLSALYSSPRSKYWYGNAFHDRRQADLKIIEKHAQEDLTPPNGTIMDASNSIATETLMDLFWIGATQRGNRSEPDH